MRTAAGVLRLQFGHTANRLVLRPVIEPLQRLL
jgi:hypothetical protein